MRWSPRCCHWRLAHEHRNYIPLLGVLLASGVGTGSRAGKTSRNRAVGVALAAHGAGLLFFRHWTAALNQFGDEVRRTQIEAQHHPDVGPARQFEAGECWLALPESARAGLATLPTLSLARTLKLAGELDPDSKFEPASA
jgi:hypothetical protein